MSHGCHDCGLPNGCECPVIRRPYPKYTIAYGEWPNVTMNPSLDTLEVASKRCHDAKKHNPTQTYHVVKVSQVQTYPARKPLTENFFTTVGWDDPLKGRNL